MDKQASGYLQIISVGYRYLPGHIWEEYGYGSKNITSAGMDISICRYNLLRPLYNVTYHSMQPSSLTSH